ncbi:MULTISPECIES: hypothetical protein [unclassified Mesorhizobium]|uniref:hypothetical protein n=1 Tax=unclassified Mesorhizobium TaxID=325217 RepID=UPI000FDCB4F7|nr:MULTISPECIES: hypothetical protein [unclassified Mesorhizobium]TGT76702.1 hypothetical protein EN809_003605 [Mesorhizobium sp. M2E.F.Ca.ET.166.01.1.1]TGW02814.1 hypothetical protein EN797_003605 [Mesorhizobium sp. M2E.F.Ca.ET.154.01.1.1]
MAISFAGGTDALQYDITNNLPAVGCISFRMKTTQTTANAAVCAYWSSTSRFGVGFLINNTANKLLALSYASSGGSNAFLLYSTTNVNDGNEHIIALNYNTGNGQPNALFVDGSQEASGNSGFSWNGLSGNILQVADMLDTFWPSYVGEMSELACWLRQLDAAEMSALGQKISPSKIGRNDRYLHAPLVGPARDRHGHAVTQIGASTTAHGPVIHPTV